MGVGILYDAGYDPHGMSQFFETLQAKYGAGSSQFMSDHPNPGNRSEYVDKEIASFVPHAHYVTNTPTFVNIQKEVNGMHAYTAREVSSGVWKKQSPNQTVSSGVNQPSADLAAPAAVDLNPLRPLADFSWKRFQHRRSRQLAGLRQQGCSHAGAGWRYRPISRRRSRECRLRSAYRSLPAAGTHDVRCRARHPGQRYYAR